MPLLSVPMGGEVPGPAAQFLGATRRPYSPFPSIWVVARSEL